MGKTIEITSRKFEISREHFLQSYAHKGQNGMDLAEAEDIKKRWQKIHRRTVQKRSS